MAAAIEPCGHRGPLSPAVAMAPFYGVRTQRGRFGLAAGRINTSVAASVPKAKAASMATIEVGRAVALLRRPPAGRAPWEAARD